MMCCWWLVLARLRYDNNNIMWEVGARSKRKERARNRLEADQKILNIGFLRRIQLLIAKNPRSLHATFTTFFTPIISGNPSLLSDPSMLSTTILPSFEIAS